DCVRIRVRRWHPGDAHIRGVGEAVETELLGLPQLHELVPLVVPQQKGPVILLPVTLRMWRAHCPSSSVAGRYDQASPRTLRSFMLWGRTPGGCMSSAGPASIFPSLPSFVQPPTTSFTLTGPLEQP